MLMALATNATDDLQQSSSRLEALEEELESRRLGEERLREMVTLLEDSYIQLTSDLKLAKTIYGSLSIDSLKNATRGVFYIKRTWRGSIVAS